MGVTTTAALESSESLWLSVDSDVSQTRSMGFFVSPVVPRLTIVSSAPLRCVLVWLAGVLCVGTSSHNASHFFLWTCFFLLLSLLSFRGRFLTIMPIEAPVTKQMVPCAGSGVPSMSRCIVSRQVALWEVMSRRFMSCQVNAFFSRHAVMSWQVMSRPVM